MFILTWGYIKERLLEAEGLSLVKPPGSLFFFLIDFECRAQNSKQQLVRGDDPAAVELLNPSDQCVSYTSPQLRGVMIVRLRMALDVFLWS